MKTCEDVLDLLPDALPWIRGEALEVHDHLKVCTSCADIVESFAQTIDAMQTQAGEPPELSAEFADSVMAALPAGKVVPFPAPKASASVRWALRAAAAIVVFAGGALTAGLASERQAGPPTVADVPSETTETDTPDTPDTPDADRTTDTPNDLQPIQTLPAELADASDSPQEDPLGHYVSEASLVLQAVDTLDTSNPDVIRLLAYHIRRTELLDSGDRLLVALATEDPNRAAALRPLISGTQLILRKVRHARPNSPALATLRNEVRETGILDAYRQLLAQDTQPSSNDPL